MILIYLLQPGNENLQNDSAYCGHVHLDNNHLLDQEIAMNVLWTPKEFKAMNKFNNLDHKTSNNETVCQIEIL